VKFSNFLFPESRDPGQDERVIDEAIAEARLTEQLGFDVVEQRGKRELDMLI